MGRMVEKTAKTVQEAIALALEELSLTIDDVEVEVLDEGKTAIFGLLGGKMAKVQVYERDTDSMIEAEQVSKQTMASESAFDADQEDDLEADTESDDEYDEEASPDVERVIEFLGRILDGIHADSQLEYHETDAGIFIDIYSEDSGILIGHRGETLDALQYLVNLYLNKGRDEFVRVTVDIEQYRKKREKTLVKLAERVAEKVIRLRRNVTMEAMNSYERRIVHSTLQGNPKIDTYSVGEEPNRKVVVALKSRGDYSSGSHRRY